MRKPRFRIWHLLLLIFVICVFLRLRHGRQQMHAASFIRDHGGYVVYENRKYDYAWDQDGALENLKPSANQPYSGMQQMLLDANHYNEIVGVRFGQILLESMEDAKKFGYEEMMVKFGRDFNADGPMQVPFNDIDDPIFAKLLRHLKTLPKLQYLGLEGSQMTDEHLQELAVFKNLKELKLGRCQSISQEAIESLSQKLPDCKISN